MFPGAAGYNIINIMKHDKPPYEYSSSFFKEIISYCTS